MELPDYYAVLEVAPDAGKAEIRMAFRRLALAYHPDLHPDNVALVTRFQQIVEAHEILSDPTRRARYDAQCAGKSPEEHAAPRPTFEEWVAQYHAR